MLQQTIHEISHRNMKSIPIIFDRLVIIYSTTESVEEILKAEEESGTPVNVSMDCLSGETLGKSLPFMARDGYWIIISTLAGIETNIPLRPLLTKGLYLVDSMLRNRTPEFKASILSQLVKEVWPKIESGAMKPSIYKGLPMEQARSPRYFGTQRKYRQSRTTGLQGKLKYWSCIDALVSGNLIIKHGSWWRRWLVFR